MNIIFIEAAVFGDLGAAGEDDAGVGLENDVRGTLIEQWTVELVAQRVAGKDFLNTQRILAGGKAEIGNHARSQRRVGQPDERAVRGNVERVRRADERGRLAAADARRFPPIDRRLPVLGADDDQRRIKKAIFLELRDHFAQRLIDEIQFAGEYSARSSQHVGVAADLQLLANADRLKVGAEECGHRRSPGVIVRETVNLVEHRLNMQRIVALDVVEVRGPAVVGSRSGSIDRRASGKLRKRYRNGVDLRTEEIIHAFSTWPAGPLVSGMFVRPGGPAAVGFYDLKDRIHPQVLVREYGRATVVWIPRQKRGIDATAAVELRQVEVDALVQFHYSSAG